ncbi:conserved hypothetical protein (plasmid) [Gloeothece citriformis PCC 7424]|uniref:Uncharacterized protein n=1 Tax=Gloeothece citriformis (strain PCC 7424) TaxID=65393 RepID=B7KMU3_GLOC7|nr:hypothetical protein [Gloeothece citriformis]ACK74115.1 conserved hypothetical protein [Gloeothece citriformis PCC 7424]
MTKIFSIRKPRRLSSPTGEKNNISDIKNLDRRSYQVFERLRDSLIDNHRNWFLIIEPDSEDYFLDKDELVAYQKAREKYPQGKFFFFRINETGVSGRI